MVGKKFFFLLKMFYIRLIRWKNKNKAFGLGVYLINQQRFIDIYCIIGAILILISIKETKRKETLDIKGNLIRSIMKYVFIS